MVGVTLRPAAVWALNQHVGCRQPSPSPSGALGLSSARDHLGAEQKGDKASGHAPWLSILLGEHQPIKVRPLLTFWKCTCPGPKQSSSA